MCAYLMYYIPSDINNDEYCVYDLMHLSISYMALEFFHCHCHCQTFIYCIIRMICFLSLFIISDTLRKHLEYLWVSITRLITT